MNLNQVVFNFHDVILLMTATLCSLFAVLLLVTHPAPTRSASASISHYFLVAFLLAHAFIPLHELISWGAEFKYKVRAHAPGLNFVGAFAYYADAVLMYFYVKALMFRDMHWRLRDWLHFLPMALFGLFMWVAFYSLPWAQQLDLINREIFVYSGPYITADFFCKTLRVIYGVAALRLIAKYTRLLQATHSNIEKVDILWLKSLVSGFLLVTAMEWVLSSSKLAGVAIHYDFQHYSLQVFEAMGLSGYYVTFILVCTLVFTSMRYFANFEAIRQRKEPEPVKKSAQEKLLNPEFAEKIDSEMRRQQAYLQPDITLDMLAELLEIPARDLSLVINRHFDKNFYEFINHYRIEEAKRRLVDPVHGQKTITEIYLDVGFNSKSVFNTFFKKLVGTTPTEFRQRGAAAS